MQIAIDGPAGSGKSTVAKKIAEKLNIIYIDTGAMYRAITLKLKDIDKKYYQEACNNTNIEFINNKIFLDGKDVSSQIRSEEISKLTSDISKIDFVRKKLVSIQKEIADKNSVVMEGRDITTVVLPDADYKFYLNASPEIRAKRRTLQLKEKGLNADYEAILRDIKKRDNNDIKRENSPLKVADDAIVIDSSNLTAEESIEKILSYIRWNMYRFLKIILYVVFKLLYRVEIVGIENIPKENNLIVAGNHKSNLDPVFVSVFFKRHIYWMAKKELFNNKLFGAFLKKLGAFPVAREEVDIKAIKTSLRHIKNGQVLGIFPEGTRVKKKNLDIIKQGTALIAHKSKALILPLYIEGNYIPFKKMKLIYRKPVDLSSLGKIKNEEYELISKDIMRRVYGDKEIGNLPSWLCWILWRC